MSITTRVLKRFEPLSSMSDEQIQQLTGQVHQEQLRQGNVIFEEGDRGTDVILLIDGRVLCKHNDGRQRRVSADTNQGRYPLGQLLPRQFTATVDTASATIARLDREVMEKMLTWSQVTSEQPSVQVTDLTSSQPAVGDWMFKLIQTPIFRDLPTGNIQDFFSRVEPVEADEGEVIVTEGEVGHYYYIIQSGNCKVQRNAPDGETKIDLAELDPGDGFGEEALLSNQPRNATVLMGSDGVLMRLARKDFDELLKAPLVELVGPREAAIAFKKMGAGLIDVRLESEYARQRLKGSMNVPLYRVRELAEELDSQRPWIVYCNTGARSMAAAFLMRERGLRVSVLQGGLYALAGKRK